ncbi:anti-sigma factor antagonist [Streptomyces zinciresistens K42]|uniref:Anti-sigma factor antagonist n=1 Tax=Streptomyces zinciresistens K42 TaxID=700597 RepID=G2GG44_9ACTN|nr:STAS domain-containing protein [Streptomyces zinciresistens]EGX57514.1 anti-sigma factor antagonist [Streptomyces zinciresistens K42]
MSGAPTSPYEGHVPVLRLGGVLLVTLQGDLYDSAAEQLRQDIGRTVSDSAVGGVVIDLSGVEIVDSFMGRVLSDVAAMTRLLAAQTVVCGMRPAVAITLVELGLTLPGLRTALNAEEAMNLLGATVSALPRRGRREST